MEALVKIACLCLTAVAFVTLLQKNNPEIGVLLLLAAAAVSLLALAAPFAAIKQLLEQMMEWSGMERGIFAPLLKTLGIALICRLGMDICKDAGQNTLASLLEIGGVFAAVMAAAPLLRAVGEMLQTML